MSKEAIAHYEAALKEAFPRGATGEVFHHWNEARYLIATEALDNMAENAKELGLDYDVKSDHRLMEQPAQQEPVAWMDATETTLSWEQFLDGMKPLYTRPQPAAWVGLTDEERKKLCGDGINGKVFQEISKMVEAKLLEKNGGKA